MIQQTHLKIYTKVCKRCNNTYETYSHHNKFCFSCNKKREKIKIKDYPNIEFKQNNQLTFFRKCRCTQEFNVLSSSIHKCLICKLKIFLGKRKSEYPKSEFNKFELIFKVL